MPPPSRPPASDPTTSKRAYDSTRRQEQARRTRRRVVEAAAALFVEQGYASTSVAEVAAAAEVSPQTIYGAFGTKAALLGAAVEIAMVGDDEPVAVLDRPEAQEALTAADPESAAAGFARMATRLLERAGRLLHAADAAAQEDPELRALWENGHRARLADMRRTADAFAASGLLRPGLDAEAAADLLWALASPDTFRSFTVLRGWSGRRYERWLRDTLLSTTLRPTDR